jgi:hypothetical protein
VITTVLAAVVDAERQRVWRAISDPAEVVRWDEPTLALLEAAAGWPRVGSPVVWRYRLGRVPVTLRDRPREVVPAERLHSDVSLGLFRFEQIWTLADEGAAGRTRLGLSVAARNSLPVVDGVLDRFDVRRIAAEYADRRLRSLQRFFQPVPPEPGAPS